MPQAVPCRGAPATGSQGAGGLPVSAGAGARAHARARARAAARGAGAASANARRRKDLHLGCAADGEVALI